MDRIAIRGGRPLSGKIRISGAKNAALPLMAASLLSDQTLALSNMPQLADIASMAALLARLGVAVEEEGSTLSLRAWGRIGDTATYDLVRRMRASVLVLGPMLARLGEARVSLPGGCAIGSRPVDIHLQGLQALGAEITLDDGYIHAVAPRGLRGAVIRMPTISVGATENLLMAAALAKGTTVLENAAREPEIADLGQCLTAMGARIDGLGGSRLEIEGVGRLGAASHPVLPDRIEAGTYAMAALITGGEVTLTGARAALLGAAATALEAAGAELIGNNDSLIVRRRAGGLHAVDITTHPFPGFATDLQAQFMALMCLADGASAIREQIFENRFMHVPELRRMGADIDVTGSLALVRSVGGLKGAPVMATDLRASVSLVLAGLAAEGETIISRVYHLDRGYERIEAKLGACGADIERLSQDRQ